MQRERIDVYDSRVEIRLVEQRDLVLDQLTLGCDEKNSHLQALSLGIRDLEVELHVIHVEWNVLLRFPTDDFPGVGFLHPIHLDRLDDHVASPDADHDVALGQALLIEDRVDSLRDQAGIHDLAFDDRVGAERAHDEPLDQGLAARMIDYGDLDETAPDVEANRAFPAAETERCHTGKPLNRLELRSVWRVSHILDILPECVKRRTGIRPGSRGPDHRQAIPCKKARFHGRRNGSHGSRLKVSSSHGTLPAPASACTRTHVRPGNESRVSIRTRTWWIPIDNVSMRDESPGVPTNPYSSTCCAASASAARREANSAWIRTARPPAAIARTPIVMIDREMRSSTSTDPAASGFRFAAGPVSPTSCSHTRNSRPVPCRKPDPWRSRRFIRAREPVRASPAPGNCTRAGFRDHLSTGKCCRPRRVLAH